MKTYLEGHEPDNCTCLPDDGYWKDEPDELKTRAIDKRDAVRDQAGIGELYPERKRPSETP